jgi:hypothetical protein
VTSMIDAARRAGRDARSEAEPRSIGETLHGLLRQAKAGAAAARATVDPDGARARFLESVRKLDAILAEDLPEMTAAIHGEVVRKSVRRKATTKMGNAWERISMVVGPPIVHLFNALSDILAGLVGWVADLFTNITKAGEAFGSFVRAVIDSPIGKILGGLGGAVGGLLGMLPHFAQGGVVDRPTLAIIGEGGQREHIIPESQLGSVGGGRTIHVHPVVNLYIDGREFASTMEKHFGALLNLRSTSAAGV